MLFTSEVANQKVRKALVTCVEYTDRYTRITVLCLHRYIANRCKNCGESAREARVTAAEIHVHGVIIKKEFVLYNYYVNRGLCMCDK